MSAKIIFENSKRVNKELVEPNILVENILKKREYIHDLEVNDILEFFDMVGTTWQADKNLQKRMPYIKALSSFMKKDNLLEILQISFRGDEKVLDGFVDFGRNKKYHAQPRGLIMHWVAGNAPLLGFYSLLLAMLTKNVSIVKPSVRAYDMFVELLVEMAKINTSKIKGEEFLQTIAVVLIDRNERKIQETFSQSADMRIAWGGREAIEAIGSLAKNVHCEDIMLGPKYSLGIIDKETMPKYKEIAKKIALDICTFDQMACSSPHTIFVEKGSNVGLENLAEELGLALDFVGKKLIPKSTVDAKKNMDILTARAKYSMLAKTIHSKNTDWTVLFDNEKNLAPAYGSRVITLREVDDLASISELITDRGKQTLGYALSGDKEYLLEKITRKGIDRAVSFGKMTFFDSPWDGMFMVDRLVRWVSF